MDGEEWFERYFKNFPSHNEVEQVGMHKHEQKSSE